MSTEEAAVEPRHVIKRFGSRPVLDDVSLTVAPGRSVCIRGRSGTGKSVALKHVVGLLKPDVGQVLIEGEDITRMSSRELSRVRRRIGFRFQGAALFRLDFGRRERCVPAATSHRHGSCRHSGPSG
jgi:phospholipid/cholesterol/gamma-HCH transport system ATP-binding protein